MPTEMVLDGEGNLIVNTTCFLGMKAEDFLKRLYELRNSLDEMGFSLDPSIKCDSNAFVKFYATHQNCTEPIKVIVRPPSAYEYYSRWGISLEFKDLKENGEIRMIYSYIPGSVSDERVRRWGSYKPRPQEIDMFTVIPYKVKVPVPKEIEIIPGIGAPTQIKCSKPEVQRRYGKKIEDDVRGILFNLGFPEDTKLGVIYDFPIRGSHEKFYRIAFTDNEWRLESHNFIFLFLDRKYPHQRMLLDTCKNL